MAVITSYGAYIPPYRLDRAVIAKAWGMPAMPGEKAVANYDEDSITMSVAACLDCLGNTDRRQIDALFLATTTSPFREKQAASIIAKALDLRPDILTADYGNSLRGAALALKAALDAVESGSARQVLVVAADCRPSAAQGMREITLGDGAVALLVGNSPGIVEVLGHHPVYNEVTDVWRAEGDRFIKSWEDRFILDKAYADTMAKAITGVMQKCELSPTDISKTALYNPEPRSHQTLARKVGLDPTKQIDDTLFFAVGNTGTALPLMMLVNALEQAEAGSKILMASYGDGADAFVLQVTDTSEQTQSRQGIKGHLGRKKTLASYETYARIRGLIPIDPVPRPPRPMPSPVVQWRRSAQQLSLIGSKCNKCGEPQYPVQRVCVYCQAIDDSQPYHFADKKARLFTYTFDNIGFADTDLVPVICCVADFEGGGRIVCQMADCDQDQVEVDMPLEMTFRKLFEAEGMPAYIWKSRPAQ